MIAKRRSDEPAGVALPPLWTRPQRMETSLPDGSSTYTHPSPTTSYWAIFS